MKYLAFLLILSIPVVLFGRTGGCVSVTEFGAAGDGVTMNTVSIQSAIDECSKSGGTVYFPAGKYLTGSLYLRSDVTIYLENGATIFGSGKLTDYKAHFPRVKSLNDAFLKYSLFYAEGEKNISIEGHGVIDGQGQLFKVTTRKKPERYMNRPFIIRFVRCSNVRVEGVSLRNSAMWMQQYLACDGLTVRDIDVFNHVNQNNDMIDIDGCRNVVVEGCGGDTDDDGIVLKSTSKYPDENISITNCIVSSHCNAIKLGTESVAGFKNICISNIVIKPSIVKQVIFGYPEGTSGITLAEVDGGTLENVNISGIVMDGPRVPIFLRLGDMHRQYDTTESQPEVGNFNNVSISNLVALNVGSVGCSITGLPGHPIEGISLSNIRISFAGGIENGIASESPRELSAHYPESTMWGTLPAYGFFLWHARDITLNNIELNFMHKDSRPAVYADDVAGLTVLGLKADVSANADGFMSLGNVRNALIHGCQPLEETTNFIRFTGKVSGVDLIGNDLRLITNVYAPDTIEGVRTEANLVGR